jgi:uncharacterized protein (DUF4415 family)
MNAKPPKSEPERVDPDDAREWTDDQLSRAEYEIGGEVVRATQGTLTRRRGRPKLASSKEQISIRLDRDVLAIFRSGGRGWHARVNRVLRKALAIE